MKVKVKEHTTLTSDGKALTRSEQVVIEWVGENGAQGFTRAFDADRLQAVLGGLDLVEKNPGVWLREKDVGGLTIDLMAEGRKFFFGGGVAGTLAETTPKAARELFTRT